MDKTLKKYLIILLICLIISGLFGIFYNLPVEFDFLNYRYYNGWAFFNNRIDIDMMPTSFRSYFNPLIDATNYILIEKLNNFPYVYLFISGLKNGLFVFITYLICDLILINKGFDRKFVIFITIILTVFSPILLFVSSCSQTDVQVAVLVLFSFYLYFRTIYEEKNKKNYFILFSSAAIMGVAVGLKYTQITFAIAMIINTVFFYKSIKNINQSFVLILFGMITGFLLSDGFWMYTLWKHFSNPFFPYFNNIFQSSQADYNLILSNDFQHLRPKNIFDFLFFPLKNTLVGNIGSEYAFFDAKIQLTFISIIIIFLLEKFKQFSINKIDIIKPLLFKNIIFITIFTYYINLILFGQYRYITPIIPLCVLIIISACYKIYSTNKLQNSPVIIVIIYITLIIYNIIFMRMLLMGYQNHIYMLGSIALLLILISILSGTIITLFFENKISNLYKNIYTSIAFITIIIFTATFFIKEPISFKHYTNNLIVQNAEIKNNSNVITATIGVSFVIPKQNPKARYIGMAIPNDFDKNGYFNLKTKYKNLYFKDKQQGKRLKQVFIENKDLYIIYSFWQTGDGFDINLINNSIQYYSDNKIPYLKNCKYIRYKIFGADNKDDVVICKLK